MSELENDASVQKLIEYAKEKKSITYDEVNDFLPDSITNTDKIEEVMNLLEKTRLNWKMKVPFRGQSRIWKSLWILMMTMKPCL